MRPSRAGSLPACGSAQGHQSPSETKGRTWHCWCGDHGKGSSHAVGSSPLTALTFPPAWRLPRQCVLPHCHSQQPQWLASPLSAQRGHSEHPALPQHWQWSSAPQTWLRCGCEEDPCGVDDPSAKMTRRDENSLQVMTQRSDRRLSHSPMFSRCSEASNRTRTIATVNAHTMILLQENLRGE